LLSNPSAGEFACDLFLLFFFFVRRVEDEGIYPYLYFGDGLGVFAPKNYDFVEAELAGGGIDTILHEKSFSISSSFSMGDSPSGLGGNIFLQLVNELLQFLERSQLQWGHHLATAPLLVRLIERNSLGWDGYETLPF
ncbi:hypothetical protein Taro_040683, partial [Colocasia esculenta]|nr:hypothetical protein [Colocasia esculenta]